MHNKESSCWIKQTAEQAPVHSMQTIRLWRGCTLQSVHCAWRAQRCACKKYTNKTPYLPCRRFNMEQKRTIYAVWVRSRSAQGGFPRNKTLHNVVVNIKLFDLRICSVYTWQSPFLVKGKWYWSNVLQRGRKGHRGCGEIVKESFGENSDVPWARWMSCRWSSQRSMPDSENSILLPLACRALYNCEAEMEGIPCSSPRIAIHWRAETNSPQTCERNCWVLANVQACNELPMISKERTCEKGVRRKRA